MSRRSSRSAWASINPSAGLEPPTAWTTTRPGEVGLAPLIKPATYRCPLCGELLPALSQHMLVMPEGDPARRRHAHSACVARARKTGRLPLKEDVEPRRPGLLSRLMRRR